MWSNRRSVLYSSGQIAATSCVLQLISFVYRIMLSRLTGSEGVALLALVMSIYSVISALSLSGISLAVSRKSAEYCATGQEKRISLLVGAARKMFFIMFFSAGVLTIIFSGLIADRLFLNADAAKCIYIILPCLFLTGLENIYKACFYGTGRVSQPLICELCEQVIRFASVGLLLYAVPHKTTTESVMLICTGMVISEIFSSSYLYIMYKRKIFKKGGHGGCGKEILSIALPVSTSGVILSLISSATTVLIPKCLIKSGLSEHAAMNSFGVMFGMTAPLAALPCAFISPLNTVLVPKYSANRVCGDKGEIRRKSGKAIHVTGLVGFFFTAVLFAFPRELSELFYPGKGADTGLCTIALINLISYYEIIFVGILNGLSRQKLTSVCGVVQGLALLCYCALRMPDPELRLNAYLTGSLVTTAVTVMLYATVVHRLTGLRHRLKNWILSPLLCACAALLCAKLIRDVTQCGAVLPFIALSGIIYLFCLRFCGNRPLMYIKQTLVKKD